MVKDHARLYNVNVHPEVRIYADPLDGLREQLTQLRGLIKLVPPMIEADRQRRWDEISQRPAGEDDDGDVIGIYESEAGEEEGWGHANFDRTIYFAAVVTGWAVLQDYLAVQLRRSYLAFDFSRAPGLAALVEDDVRSWDRRFDNLTKRYRDFAGISLSQLPGWDHVQHAQALRNALVHNQGQYTRAYLQQKHAYRPTEEDLMHFVPPGGDAGLIDHEVIPLSLTLVDEVIVQLRAFAEEARSAIESAQSKRPNA